MASMYQSPYGPREIGYSCCKCKAAASRFYWYTGDAHHKSGWYCVFCKPISNSSSSVSAK